MPDSVETPAPVNTHICFDEAIISSSLWIFGRKSSSFSLNSPMYRIYDSVNSKNYLITKRSTKNSTLVVYSYDNDASSFSSTTIRYGYAAKIAKDLVCSAYQLTSTDPFNILVATNESGMVSLSINMAYVTSDDSSNGSTTDFEKFEF